MKLSDAHRSQSTVDNGGRRGGRRICEIARRLGRRWNSVRGRRATLARREERAAAGKGRGHG